MSQVCKRCEKIDPSVNQTGYCKTCLVLVRSEYDVVRQYVRLHPNVSVMEVHRATGVSLKSIGRMVNDGDLSLVEELSPK